MVERSFRTTIGLNNRLPGNGVLQASRLREEGFRVETKDMVTFRGVAMM
jgi:hypothetical protein